MPETPSGTHPLGARYRDDCAIAAMHHSKACWFCN